MRTRWTPERRHLTPHIHIHASFPKHWAVFPLCSRQALARGPFPLRLVAARDSVGRFRCHDCAAILHKSWTSLPLCRGHFNLASHPPGSLSYRGQGRCQAWCEGRARCAAWAKGPRRGLIRAFDCQHLLPGKAVSIGAIKLLLVSYSALPITPILRVDP